MKKLYAVAWITKRNRRKLEHEQVFEAVNAKAARAAFDRWYAGRWPGPPPRPLRVTVTPIR